MQLSTAVSDFILAFVSFAVALSLLRLSRISSAFGFLITAVAASLGSVKFGQEDPSPSLIKYHSLAAWLASVVGITLITVDYHFGNHQQSIVFSFISVILLCAIPVVLLAKFFGLWSNRTDTYVTDAMGLISVLSLLLSSLLDSNSSCLVGSLMYVVAGIIGTQGTLYNLRRVDWFHYLLAFGNVAFFLAFKNKPDPVYFKSQ